MAKITKRVNQRVWSAKIRCAHPTGFFGLHKVEGCFRVFKISLADIRLHDYGDGDLGYSAKCPYCGQVLHPQWQIGIDPCGMESKVKRFRKSRKGVESHEDP